MIDKATEYAINPKPKVVESSSTERRFTLETDRDRSKNGANREYGPCQTGKIAREDISEIRLWPKVDKNGQIPAHRPELGPCWDWKGAKNSRGYGCFAVNGVSQLSHRVSVILSGRDIPEGMTVDHLCRNIVCCNPVHLEVVTLAVNISRMPAAVSRFCKRGHEYTAENTIIKRGRLRNCRICHNMRRRWKEFERTSTHQTARKGEGL